MISDEADEVTKGLFDSFKDRYQNNLEQMKSSKFVFDYVLFLYHKCPNCGGSYTDSLEWN